MSVPTVPSRRNVLAGAFGLGALGASALSAEPAAAAVGDVTLPEAPTKTFYLKVTGPVVDGSATERGFERQIPVETWGWGASLATGGAGGTGVGRVTPDELIVVAYSDIHSPKLSQSVHVGRTHATATLTCRHSTGNSTFMTLFFNDAAPVDYYVTPHPLDGRPLDVFKFTMRKVTQTFFPPSGTPVSMAFDYSTGSAIPVPPTGG